MILQRVLVGKPKTERLRLEDLGADGMTILKFLPNKYCESDVDWIHLAQDRKQRPFLVKPVTLLSFFVNYGVVHD